MQGSSLVLSTTVSTYKVSVTRRITSSPKKRIAQVVEERDHQHEIVALLAVPKRFNLGDARGYILDA